MVDKVLKIFVGFALDFFHIMSTCEAGSALESERDTTAGRITIDIPFSKNAVELLCAESRAVYTQYVKDSDNSLLVDGYFGENMPNRVLPPVVNQIIASYYSKTYSIQYLHQEIISLHNIQSAKRQKKAERKRKCKKKCTKAGYFFIGIVILFLTFTAQQRSLRCSL